MILRGLLIFLAIAFIVVEGKQPIQTQYRNQIENVYQRLASSLNTLYCYEETRAFYQDGFYVLQRLFECTHKIDHYNYYKYCSTTSSSSMPESEKTLEKAVEALLLGATEIFVAGIQASKGDFVTAAGFAMDGISRLKSSYQDFRSAIDEQDREMNSYNDSTPLPNQALPPDEFSPRDY